jgi:hypothetical protein
VIWPGPPIDTVDGGPSPTIDALAAELAARRVPMEQAEPQIEAFAASLDDAQKDEQLIKLFVHARDHQPRTQLDHRGIKEYARGQRLAETINDRTNF